MSISFPNPQLRRVTTAALLLLLLAPGLTASTARGSTATWAGPSSDNLWATPANWLGTTPSSGDDAVFPSLGGLRSVDLSGSLQVSSVQFNSTSPDTYLLYNGSLGISSSINQAGSADATLLCPVSFGGALTLSGTGAGNVYLQGGLSGSPFITMTGGNYWWSDVSGFNPAGLSLTGGYLHLIGTNQVNFGGNVQISGNSTLCVQGFSPSGVGASSWDVLTGGTLKVNGTISGPVNVSGGTFVAGCSPGTADVQGNLFFDTAAQTEFELATPGIVGSGNDWVSVSGVLTLGGTIKVVALPGFGAGTYRLFDYAGGLNNNGVQLGQSPNGFACTLDFSTFGQVNLVVTPATPQSYDVTVPAGLSLIASQLDHGSNTVDDIMASPPNGTKVSKYNNASGTWSQSTYSGGAGTPGAWSVPDLTLNPGEGAWLESPSSFTLTFTGTPHVPVLPLSIAPGSSYLVSRQTNGIGTYENIVGLPPTAGVRVFQWTGSGYHMSSFDPDLGGWDPAEPSAAVGEALWIQPAGSSGPPPVPQSYFIDIVPGPNLIANHYDHGSNTLNEVLPNVPDGTALYKRNNGGSNASWTISTYSAATGTWLNGDTMTLSPGEGAFLDSPTACTLTFTGIPHVPVLPVTIPQGQAVLLSRQTAEVGTYETITGNSPPDGATVYQWNGSSYVIFLADSTSPTGWDDAIGNPVPAPTAPIGGALWISPSGTGTPALPPAGNGLTVISPAAGNSLCAGSTTTITWSGGNPAWNVLISLVDVPSWTVYTTITPSTPNNGSYVWNIPPGLPASTYLIYIQEVSVLTWTYGGNFAIHPCPTNSCVPPPSGLGLWLPFDETTGTTSANLFAGGSPGTRLNAPVVISGYVANSLAFNGANQFVKVPSYPAINPGAGQDFSIDAWVKRASNAPNSLPSIIVDKRDPNTIVGYSLALSFGNLIFQMCDAPYSYNNYRDTGVIPPDNKWHLVAVTVSRNLTNGGRFFIDGVQQSTFDPTANAGSLASTAPFQVAASPIGGNRPWLGAIDEVEYFQRAILPSEVLAIYNAGAAGKCKCLTPPANMSLWLPLDETTGTTSANLAPSSNNGTHVNTPSVISGYVANSLSFNGINQYVTVPDYPAINPGAGQDFSIDAWVKRSATSPNSPPSIIVDKRDPNTGVGYSLALSYGNLIWQMNDGSGYTNYRDTGTIPPDNKWHLVAVTLIRNLVNGGRFYIDGVPQSTFNPTPYPGSLATTAPFQVAASLLGGNKPWLGAIDEVEFFQRALLPSEVLAIFNAGALGKCKQGCGSDLVLGCATNRTVECGSAWQFNPPTTTQSGCSDVSLVVLGTVTNANPLKPCWQDITRTWLASDCCGHSNMCAQTITIADRTPPVATCSPGFGTDCTLPWSFTPPTAVDSCSGTNVTITVLNTTTNGRCPYSITRTWLVRDTCGNATTCSQNVVIGDSTPPSISCIASRTVECGSQWAFDQPAAFDACPGATVTVTVLSTLTNGPPCSQVITRTWVATNPCGVTNTCSQTVFTQDTTPPVIACPHDKTVECGSVWAFDQPSAVDACCGNNVSIALLSTFTNSLQKCSTAISRTWSATDCCGNSNTCVQTVTITDTTPPVFATSCVTNVIMLGGNNFTTPIAASPSAGLLARLHAAGVFNFKGFDQCSVNTYFAHSFTNLPHCLTSAILEVRLKPCGESCYNDAINLSFTSPSGVLQTNSWTRYLGAGNAQPGFNSDDWCTHTGGQVFVWNLAALPQAIGGPLNLLPQLNSLGYLDFNEQDDSGVDYVKLTLVSCCYQPSKTVPCGSQWTFDTPTATDACCVAPVTVSVLSTVTNGLCPKVAIRTWQATDCCGNSSFFSQTVTMIDTNPPIVYCPGPITRYVCANSDRVSYYVYAYDACSGYRPVSCTPASGSVFPLGTTVVHCTATDACGNVGSCSFTVTVLQQILTGSMLLGLPDCYKLPTELAPKSAALLAAHPGSCWKQFDSTAVNCALGASFMGLPNTLTCGKLTVTMKPNCSDLPYNDSLSLGLATNASGAYTNAWSSYIGGGNASPGLTQAEWCGQTGCAQQFTLNLASMPAPGGNLLPLMNAQGKLDLYIQDDTTVDFARLDYCYCRVKPWWGGWDWNLVNADIAVGQGFASFSPLWSVGYPTNYSVSLAPGATHGVQLGLVPLNLGSLAGSSLTVAARSTLDPDVDAIQLLGDGNGLVQFMLRASKAKTSEATLNVRRGGFPLALTNRPPVPDTVLLSLVGAGSLTQITATHDGDTYTFRFDAPGTVVDMGGVQADEVEVTFTHTDPSPETLLASLDLDLAGLSELQLTSAAAEVTGLFPQPTGDTTATAAGDQLIISNLGTNGADGCIISLAPTNQLVLALTALQNGNGVSQSNGLLAGTFTGMVGPDVAEVCHFSWTQTAGGWDLDGDFAALSPSTLHLQVFNLGALVAEVVFTGHPHVPVLPARIGLEVSAQETWASFIWDDPQSILMDGSNSYIGDELRLVPVAPDLTLSSITGATVHASGMDALVLSAAGQPAPVWVLQTPVVTPASMTIQWSGPVGGILNSASSPLGPWTPVPGQNGNSANLPSPLTNGTPRQFFRVQSN